jgi:hypothetical protein
VRWESGDDEFPRRRMSCRAIRDTGTGEVDCSRALRTTCGWRFGAATHALDVDPIWFGAGCEGVAGPMGIWHVTLRGRLNARFGW